MALKDERLKHFMLVKVPTKAHSLFAALYYGPRLQHWMGHMRDKKLYKKLLQKASPKALAACTAQHCRN